MKNRTHSLLPLLALALASPVAAQEVIDFENLGTGDVVDSVFSDGGVGPVTVSGSNPDAPLLNAAVIFDTNAPNGDPCGGDEDFDLGTPNEDFGGPGIGVGGEAGSPFQNDTALNNVLIINEACGLGPDPVARPNDADNAGAFFIFGFDAIGPVTIHGITLIDVEAAGESARVVLFAPGGAVLADVELPRPGDNGVAVVDLGGVAGVGGMEVDLNGSGAIDGIEFEVAAPFCGDGVLDPGEQCDDGNNEDGDGCNANCQVETAGGEGCTPGFWRQPFHFDFWQGFDPDDDYEATFGVDASFSATLHEALVQGGGGEKALGRHAVAALLNASTPEVDYDLTPAEVISIVFEAYQTGEFEDAKDRLEESNEAGCPLGNDEEEEGEGDPAAFLPFGS